MYITSFYSFKGGVGRTVGLLNVGWHLARRGRWVALLDLDLEAPGLSSACLLEESRGVWVPPEPSAGFCELVQEFQEHSDIPQDWTTRHLCAGLGPDRRMALIAAAGWQATSTLEGFVQGFSWADFYLAQGGREFMEALVDGLADLGLDYLLIDARTGFTDVAGISLLQLPDLGVLFTNLSQQSVAGIKERLQEIEKVNIQCRTADGSAFRRRNAAHQPIDTLVVGSPLPTGEWRSRQDRIREIEVHLGCRLAVQVDYLPLLALDEGHHILAQHLPDEHARADELLLGATRCFERLAQEIARRNPEDPDNLIVQGHELFEIGLWREALTHFGEVIDRRREAEDDLTTGSALEARFHKVPAQLQGLDAALAAEDLDGLHDELGKAEHLDANALRLAQDWLAVSYTSVLISEFRLAAEAAEKAKSLIGELKEPDRSDLQAKSLKALACLRLGYAQGLTGEWSTAADTLSAAEAEYDSLRTRPLLHCRCLAELAQARMMIGQNLEKEVTPFLERARQIADGRESASGKLTSDLVRAHLHLAQANLLTEQGRGDEARVKLSAARKLFAEDRDDVGQTDVVLAWTALGLKPEQFEGNDEDAGKDWAHWQRTADEQLRMPRVARRLKLRQLAWKLALGEPGSEDAYKELLAQIENGLVKAQDPAFPALVRLEYCRYLLLDGDRLDDVEKQLAKVVEAQSVTGVREETEHDLRVLYALYLLARGDSSGEAKKLQEHADGLRARGYALREAQARFALAMLNGAAPGDAVIGKLQAPADWFWNFPLLFLGRSTIDNLRVPYQRLIKQLGPQWPMESP